MVSDHMVLPRTIRLRSWLTAIILAAISFRQAGCALTAPYDQYVYAQTTGLKVDALNLMDRAEKPYDSQLEAIGKFTPKDLQR